MRPGTWSNGMTWLLHMAVQLYGLPFLLRVTTSDISWGTTWDTLRYQHFVYNKRNNNEIKSNWSTGDKVKKKKWLQINYQKKKNKVCFHVFGCKLKFISSTKQCDVFHAIRPDWFCWMDCFKMKGVGAVIKHQAQIFRVLLRDAAPHAELHRTDWKWNVKPTVHLNKYFYCLVSMLAKNHKWMWK